MNKAAYMLGYRQGSTSLEDFKKLAFLEGYDKELSLEKQAVWGELWDDTTKAVGNAASGAVDRVKSSYDPSALWDSDTVKGIAADPASFAADAASGVVGGVGGAVGNVAGEVAQAGGEAASGIGNAAVKAGKSIGSSAMGVLKNNWMSLLFGGLAVGGGLSALFSGGKGKDKQGARSYNGPMTDQYGLDFKQGGFQQFDRGAYQG